MQGWLIIIPVFKEFRWKANYTHEVVSHTNKAIYLSIDTNVDPCTYTYTKHTYILSVCVYIYIHTQYTGTIYKHIVK